MVSLQNTCGVKVDATGCAEKRSCRSCLSLTQATDGLECFLDATSGVCTTLADIPNATLSSMGGVSNATQQLEALEALRVFTSSRVKYCSENDGACALCEAVADLKGYTPSASQLKRMSSDRSICYGTNDCICVTKCEGREWTANAGNRCEVSSLPSYCTVSPESKNTESKMLTFISTFVLIPFAVVVLVIVWKKWQERRSREANGPYNNPVGLSEENRLQLPGWTEWQRQLRANDKQSDPSTLRLGKLMLDDASELRGHGASIASLDR